MLPRQSGKTTMAIYEFNKDPDNTLFVCHNYELANFIRSKVGGDKKNFTSAEQFHQKVISRRPKNIILDEYMFFKNKDEIYNDILQVIRPENLYIFSSSNKSYNKEVFDFVKENKQTTSYVDLLDKYGDGLADYIKEEIYELYHNFLTDYDTHLIYGDFK